jgi:hypothetical protein
MVAHSIASRIIGCCTALLVLAVAWPARSAPAVNPVRARVSILADSLLNTFDPKSAWGAALDGKTGGMIDRIYTRHNIRSMKRIGFGPVTCRLRTELGIEAWHWNPNGTWSDPARRQGYWTSSDRSDSPIAVSYGYRLPRRGRTIDDANGDGFSRIDDGDTTTYWKSNPYLDARYTHQAEALHPQWLVVDLGAALPVDAVRIAWGDPFPQRYRIEYWVGDQTAKIDYNPDGDWRRFPAGDVTSRHGEARIQRVARAPVRTRFVRITLWQSSHTAVAGSSDARDSLGFALREIAIGTLDRAGEFHDLVRHGASATGQSWVLVSSTDPWHRERDRDPDVEQPGIDLVFRIGLTHKLPTLLAVGVLYDTPGNAAALLRYVRWRRYQVPRIELGEEPDGQRVTPEDYAALYLQAADSLRAVDPRIVVGGPSWQSAANDEMVVWPDRVEAGKRSGWLGRFLDALDRRHALDRLGFFSFEWYPFDHPCDSTDAQLARAPWILASALARQRREGLPDSIPRILTEYGYSAYAGPAEVEVTGALLNAEALAGFFRGGGSEAYVYGTEPGDLDQDPRCKAWGNNLLLLADEKGRAAYQMPTFHAARLLAGAWADPHGGTHRMFATRVSGGFPRSRYGPLVSAYALYRPDGRWSLLLINRDANRPWSVVPSIREAAIGASRPFQGPLDLWQYSAAQYRWQEDGDQGHPTLDLPPSHQDLDSAAAPLILPPYSISVLVGR